jgi:small-conductance mechanosensitive channel
MRRRVGIIAAALPLLALWWSAAIAAQDAAPPAAAPKPGPEAVAQADIALRADADERFAREVIQRSQGRDPTDKFGPRLDDLAASVQQEAERFKRDELKLLAIARLESLDRHWAFFGKQLAAWRRDLAAASSQYTEDAAELTKRRAVWEATKASAGPGGMAPALANRVQSVLAQISLAEQAVSGPIDRQIRLGRRANAIETSILAGQKAVTAAIAYNDSRLARVDSPPLWQAGNEPQASVDPLRSITAGLEVEKNFLDAYNAANARYLQSLNILGLLLLPLLLWLSRRSRKVVSDDPEIQASTRVLQRPISSWLVLAMLGIVLLEPDAPMLRQQLALMLALIPVLRLLPPAVYKALGPWPYIATGLYLLHRLGFLLLANPYYHRVYLLAITLLAAVLLAWVMWLRRPRPAEPAPSRTRKIVRFAGWGAIATLLVSAVANVVGNVSLAEMLTVAILDSGYVGLVLYAGVTVLASVLRLLLARRAISRFRVVTQHAGPLLHSVTRLLRFGALAAWTVVVLNEFRVYRPIRDAVAGMLTHELRFGQISLTLGGVLLFMFSVWLAFWAAKTVRLILQDDVLPKMSLPRGVGNSISSLTYYAMVIFGLFVALAAAGFEVSQLAFVIGALGVGIGLGLQGVVNNFVSGLILMFERPIQPGDVVEVGGTSGKVREIGMRSTTLSTFEGADVVVPNGMLLSEKLINWTLSDMDRRIDVNLGVAYGSDPRKVLEILLEVTRTSEGIATEPAPNVLFIGFGANSLDFGIRAWTNNFGDWVKIRSDLSVRVYEALGAAGIAIPFPQYDLHLRSISPEARAALGMQRPPEASPAASVGPGPPPSGPVAAG